VQLQVCKLREWDRCSCRQGRGRGSRGGRGGQVGGEGERGRRMAGRACGALVLASLLPVSVVAGRSQQERQLCAAARPGASCTQAAAARVLERAASAGAGWDSRDDGPTREGGGWDCAARDGDHRVPVDAFLRCGPRCMCVNVCMCV